MSRIVLRVEIEDADPLIGLVVLLGTATSIGFEGWTNFVQLTAIACGRMTMLPLRVDPNELYSAKR